MTIQYNISKNYKLLKHILDDNIPVILIDDYYELSWMKKFSDKYYAYFKHIAEFNIPVDSSEQEFIDVCSIGNFSFIIPQFIKQYE